MNENTQGRQEEIRKMVTRIFYMPATNGQAMESIEEGVRLVEEFIADLPSPAAPAYPRWVKAKDFKGLPPKGEKKSYYAKWTDDETPFIVWYWNDARGWGVRNEDIDKMLILDESPSPEVNVAELARVHAAKSYAKAPLQDATDAEYIQDVSYHSFIAGYNAKP